MVKPLHTAWHHDLLTCIDFAKYIPRLQLPALFNRRIDSTRHRSRFNDKRHLRGLFYVDAVVALSLRLELPATIYTWNAWEDKIVRTTLSRVV